MNKIVNFEDSIFILEMRIRMIRDTLLLDAEPELFLERTLDDICFTDDRMRILLAQLQENHRLIDREELLEQFADTEERFSQALREMLEHDGNISIREIPPIQEKIRAFLDSSLERRRIAATLSPLGASVNGIPIVSTDELTELLKAF